MNFEVLDAGRKGDLLYTTIDLMLTAFEIGKSEMRSGGVTALATLTKRHSEVQPKTRKSRKLGIQLRVREALKQMYSIDPLETGLSRDEVVRAVACKIGVAVGAFSPATLDRARTAIWVNDDV